MRYASLHMSAEGAAKRSERARVASDCTGTGRRRPEGDAARQKDVTRNSTRTNPAGSSALVFPSHSPRVMNVHRDGAGGRYDFSDEPPAHRPQLSAHGLI